MKLIRNKNSTLQTLSGKSLCTNLCNLWIKQG